MAGHSYPEDCGHIWFVVPIAYKNGAAAVNYDDGVVVCGSDGFDECVAVLPEGEIVAISFVVVDDDEVFA